jgi:hypothetical protein
VRSAADPARTGPDSRDRRKARSTDIRPQHFGRAEGYQLEVRPPIQLDGGAHGWTSRERDVVWLSSTCDEAERIRILAHELAHIRGEHFHRDVSRAQGECEADSVAYVVCKALGLDISSSSVDYVATWASRDNPEVLNDALAAIYKASSSILADIEEDRD